MRRFFWFGSFIVLALCLAWSLLAIGNGKVADLFGKSVFIASGSDMMAALIAQIVGLIALALIFLARPKPASGLAKELADCNAKYSQLLGLYDSATITLAESVQFPYTFPLAMADFDLASNRYRLVDTAGHTLWITLEAMTNAEFTPAYGQAAKQFYRNYPEAEYDAQTGWPEPSNG